MPYLHDYYPAKQNFEPYERWQLETARAEQWNMPDPSIYYNQANLYRRISSIFTAVDIVASAGALTPFSVKRVMVDKEPKDIPNHDFEMRLNRPNPEDSRYEFLYATIAFWKLNRNAYWWLNREDETAPPDEMWFIPPHMIKPIPDELNYLSGYYYYPGNGQELFLPPHEIVHFKGFNPFSRFTGLSAAIESLSMIAQGYIGMTEWQTRLYKESNARLPSVLAFKNFINDTTWKDIKVETAERARKREMLMLRGVGDQVQWLQNASTQKDMEFIETLDAVDKKIMDTLAPGAYTMLYENANEANSRTGKATLNEFAIYPMHVMMAEKMTNDILPAYPGRPLVGEFEDIRISDKQMELQEQDHYEKTHTIDEIREEYYGDEPIGDERGKLLLSQVNAQSGNTFGKPAPSPFGANGNKPEQELNSAQNEPPEEPTEEEKNKQELEDALAKYERYALRVHSLPAEKKAGVRPFSNSVLPAKTIQEIAVKLTGVRTEEEIRSVFAEYRNTVLKVNHTNGHEVALLTEYLRKAIAKI